MTLLQQIDRAESDLRSGRLDLGGLRDLLDKVRTEISGRNRPIRHAVAPRRMNKSQFARYADATYRSVRRWELSGKITFEPDGKIHINSADLFLQQHRKRRARELGILS